MWLDLENFRIMVSRTTVLLLLKCCVIRWFSSMNEPPLEICIFWWNCGRLYSQNKGKCSYCKPQMKVHSRLNTPKYVFFSILPRIIEIGKFCIEVQCLKFNNIWQKYKKYPFSSMKSQYFCRVLCTQSQMKQFLSIIFSLLQCGSSFNWTFYLDFKCFTRKWHILRTVEYVIF